jgi:hypothetical protein
MTADLSFLTELPGRCPDCLLHTTTQGHRSHLTDGTPTGCDNTGPLGLILGRKLAKRGMARAEAAHPADVEIVDKAIAAACARGQRFSANDFRHLVPKVERAARHWRAVSRRSSTRQIRRVGDTPSSSPGTHAHRIGVYEAASP